MLYYIFYSLRDYWTGFNVFKYLTVRAAMASLTALLISLIFGPAIIRWLKKLSFGQYIRKEHVESLYDITKHKQGTPTMGGVLIIVSISVATILWADVLNIYVLMTLGAFIFLGIVGFADDYIKVTKKRNLGLTANAKFLSQVFLALIIATFVIVFTPIPTTLNVPFLKFFSLELGILYLVFVIIVITGSSNAVNLTDGLDGLAIGCTIIAAIS
ncbi:MAG: phospho-N-acetylmuramoyl-pentapeptide-transferase, partial [Candidatus Omnitrophica bacterium]|nr:phospho-N-acetylmuramoyl-pentapeptide-transferase [Candidatus Omnitrophota bacterium]